MTHSLDINPGKFDIESNEEGSYLNKGKMQALIFTIFNKDWENFNFGWKAAHRYLSGWHVFSAFRAFIEYQWPSGMQLFLKSEFTLKVLIAMPLKNRNELMDNLRQFSKINAKHLNLHDMILLLIDEIQGKLQQYDDKHYEQYTTQVFNFIFEDDA